ncbi:MAG: hypothetical protein AAGF73_04755 [Actinomycetota bacterium]
MAIAYSNGLSLSIGYDAVTGQPAIHEWRNAAGDVWSDQLTATTQSGRILEHALVAPEGSATFDYTYDPTSSALIEATVTGTGDGPLDTQWTWVIERGLRLAKTTADSGGTTALQYHYDPDLAPTAVHETVTASADGVTTERAIPLELTDGSITRFDEVLLDYDAVGLVAAVADDVRHTALDRDASGAIVREVITEG